ncbi:putative lipid II flippase FtsW [bacterium]|nr:MAG: putative lipid II flippase FtsW [bacterium]
MVAGVAALVGIGLVMIFSASSVSGFAEHHDTTYYLKRQLLWLALSLPPALLAYRMDYRRLERWTPWLMGLAVFSLAAVLLPHVGTMVGGARRWFALGPVSLQPSEFAKLALVIYLAHALSQKSERVTSLQRGVFPIVVVIGILALLVLRQPDMGTASLYVMVGLLMLFVAGARIPHLVATLGCMAPLVAYAVLMSPYKRARIMAFLDPWKDPQNTGFHIIQSLLALGSGGIFGLGLGESRQKFFYLPEQYTDFIFAVIGEELGLIGSVVVLGLFVWLAYRAIRIAIAAPDAFGFYLAAGCAATIVLQALVNIGVVTSSWPVTGVPLPFISFGGSSLMVNLVCVALILNVGCSRRAGIRVRALGLRGGAAA